MCCTLPTVRLLKVQYGHRKNGDLAENYFHLYIYIYILYIRFEVLAAVTMTNAAFWDIETQFVPYRKHIDSPLYNQAG
jgi:hypothetical protein